MNHPILATNHECTGCMACVDACHSGALTRVWNEEGHLTYRCDTNKCVLCHQCEKVCPVVSHYRYQEESSSKFFAAWCKDDILRKSSSSGGAFAAMASYVIAHGGWVVGASNEGVCDIKHIAIDHIKDLHKLQGSKYTQSDATGSYSLTLRLLNQGKLVLYSGTGCQVSGLLSYLKQKRYSGKLITVDIVCGGVPSRYLIDKFLENEPYKVRKVVSFRSKDNGWKSKGFTYNLITEDDKGNKHDYTGIHNLITDGFSREMTERYSCYNCQFNGVGRQSQFTIGDLWGDKQFVEQHEKGLSLVIAHKADSLRLLHAMAGVLETVPIDSNEAINHNYRINKGFNVRQFMWERKYLSFMFSHFSYSTLKHIYANDIAK